jgi:hypothetical protein
VDYPDKVETRDLEMLRDFHRRKAGDMPAIRAAAYRVAGYCFRLQDERGDQMPKRGWGFPLLGRVRRNEESARLLDRAIQLNNQQAPVGSGGGLKGINVQNIVAILQIAIQIITALRDIFQPKQSGLDDDQPLAGGEPAEEASDTATGGFMATAAAGRELGAPPAAGQQAPQATQGQPRVGNRSPAANFQERSAPRGSNIARPEAGGQPEGPGPSATGESDVELQDAAARGQDEAEAAQGGQDDTGLDQDHPTFQATRVEQQKPPAPAAAPRPPAPARRPTTPIRRPLPPRR